MKMAQDYLDNSSSGNCLGGFNSRLFGDSYNDTTRHTSGSVFNQRSYGWYLADEMIKEGKIFSEIKTQAGRVRFKCFADGDKFCCVGEGFENLQESDNYAFGDTFDGALKAFLALQSSAA